MTNHQDRIEAFAREVRERFPSCSRAEALVIAERACEPGSGRVGTRDDVEDPIRAAVVAHIRHQHTGYDDDLMISNNRGSARGRIKALIDDQLRRWQEVPGAKKLDF